MKQQNVWANDMVKTFNPLDMLFWKDYAVTNSKPFMICEWGCYAINHGNGGGDDAYFIQQMHDFAVANDIAMLCYFDYAGLQALFNSLLTPTQFPYASALYRQLVWTDWRTNGRAKSDLHFMPLDRRRITEWD